MERVRVDWHIHTTLSPCGSLEMDPLTILGKARQKGIQVIGITDHNSTLQARQIIRDFPGSDPMVLAGAEVTTQEEIHCLVFFDDLVVLDEFQQFLDAHLPSITNRPEFFGDQVVVDKFGRIVYEENRLLISALDQSLDSVIEFASSNGGIVIPAHINRPGFSLLSQLGMIPRGLKVDAVEWVPDCKGGIVLEKPDALDSLSVVFSSDAHYLNEIGIRFTELDIPDRSFGSIRRGIKQIQNHKQ